MAPMQRIAVAAAVAVTFGMERLVLSLAIIGVLAWLTAIDKIDSGALVAFITLLVGYVFGASSPTTVQAAHDTVQNGQSETPEP